MRLIDADALYRSLGASGNCNACPLDAYKCQYYKEHTLMEFCEFIDDAPTIEAVPVVRCKDCKHNYGKEHGKFYNPEDIVCVYWEADGLNDDDFCSYGERSEDDRPNQQTSGDRGDVMRK